MDSFFDTANRMYKSSKTLHDNSEYHNACYLAGYVIECYAKILVQRAYGFDNKTVASEFCHDLKSLNKELKYIFTNTSEPLYGIDMSTVFETILSGIYKWNPIKRYSADLWKKEASILYQQEILFAIEQLAILKNDGLNLQ